MTAGRPLSFDPQQALAAATTTFWSRGYEASSMQDLLAATRLAKSSLYQQFGSKRELFCRCLDHYTDEAERLLEALLQHSPSGRSFIEMVLTQIISEPAPAKGCLIFNSASEFGERDVELAAHLRHCLSRLRGIFLQALEWDRAAGRLAAEADTEALADYLMSSIGGLRSMVKMGTDAESLKSTMAIVLKAIA